MLEESQGPDDIPTELHMMRHVYRSVKYSPKGANIKEGLTQMTSMQQIKFHYSALYILYTIILRILY